jgi:hypothetical protein
MPPSPIPSLTACDERSPSAGLNLIERDSIRVAAEEDDLLGAHRRLVRLQATTDQGAAYLLRLSGGRWWVEAIYD